MKKQTIRQHTLSCRNQKRNISAKRKRHLKRIQIRANTHANRMNKIRNMHVNLSTAKKQYTACPLPSDTLAKLDTVMQIRF